MTCIQSVKMITAEVTGKETTFSGVLSAGDSYWTILAGIPALFFGPGSMSVAHTNKEQVAIDELMNASKIYALFALRNLC